MRAPNLLAAVPAPGAAVIHDSVALFERTFPGRVRAYYLEGSWADGTMLETSDLDLVVVFKGQNTAAERAQAAELRTVCEQASSLEFDATIIDEAALVGGASPQLALGAQLVYGEDIRSRLDLVPIAAWTRDRMHTSYWRTIRLFARPTPVCLPIGYPDPTAEFYGYVRRATRLPDGSTVPGTRDLVRSVGWTATALVAWRAGQYVARKRDCHRVYRACIGDQWAALIEDIYALCRAAWRYGVPDAAEDRARLRVLCERTLLFENAFLALYRAFLIEELEHAPEADRAHARWVVAQLPWEDSAVHAACAAAGCDRNEPAADERADALATLPVSSQYP